MDLGFAIIAAMALFVLRYDFYNQNYATIQNIVENISYWSVVVIDVGILALAIV